MKKILFVAMTVVGTTALLGCASNAPVPASLVTLGVDFNWSSHSGCPTLSPQINLSNVPTKAKKIKVNMVDKQNPTFNHGGGMVAYVDNVLPEGALKSYYGPCPPSGTHRYEITVDAIDANHVVVGRGKATRDFSK